MANGPSYARWSLEPYSIGMKLRTLRTQKHLTLSRLAAETGLSTALLSKLETDRMIPTLPTLANICRVYGVGLSYFFQRCHKTHPGHHPKSPPGWKRQEPGGGEADSASRLDRRRATCCSHHGVSFRHGRGFVGSVVDPCAASSTCWRGHCIWTQVACTRFSKPETASTSTATWPWHGALETRAAAERSLSRLESRARADSDEDGLPA